MNQAGFSKGFRFVTYHYGKYRYTDSRQGSDRHFIGYLEQGHCRLVSPDRTLEISAGEAFYIPMGLRYQSYWYGQQVQFRSYGFDYFPEAENRSFALQKLPEESIPLIMRIPLQRYPDSGGLRALFSVLEQLVPHLEISPVCFAQQLLNQALDYMYEHPDCTNEDVARYCCISQSALYALFRKKAGRTPNEMHQAMTAQRAVHLLTTTDLPVQRISEQLHFSSPSYFRKVLKKHTGKTPRQIRKDTKTV